MRAPHSQRAEVPASASGREIWELTVIWQVIMDTAGEKNGQEASTRGAPVLCSQRWNLAALAFFGFLFVYTIRVNLSVAIICMVRVPQLSTDNPIAYNSSSDLTTALNSSSDLNAALLLASTASPAGPSLSRILPLKGQTKLIVVLGQEEGACQDELKDNKFPVSQKGEFDWDKGTRAKMLAMYFYGYIFTQIPSGWLAGRYGGKTVWGVGQAVSALCTLLTPKAARTHVYLVYTLRFLIGLAAGVTFPCVHAMLGRWAPKLERSRLVAFSFAGPPIATILTFSFSALLCDNGFDNGWGSIFYLSGAGNLLWVLLWQYVTADTPSQHGRISPKEREYILHSIGERPDTKEKIDTPWKAMFTSGPLWAVITAHACNNYTGYTLLTSLPTFMKEVLKYDIKQNGALSALPYVCQALSAIFFGNLADWLRARRLLTTRATRKLMQCTSFLGVAVCILCAGFVTCQQRYVSVFLICLCLTFMGMNRAGYLVNHIDLAPRHAGVLFGITNTAATLPGMVAPLIAGALTPNSTAEEWRGVFYICSATAALGALVFGLLADGELQTWAAPPEMSFEFCSSDVIKDTGACDLPAPAADVIKTADVNNGLER